MAGCHTFVAMGNLESSINYMPVEAGAQRSDILRH